MMTMATIVAVGRPLEFAAARRHPAVGNPLRPLSKNIDLYFRLMRTAVERRASTMIETQDFGSWMIVPGAAKRVREAVNRLLNSPPNGTGLNQRASVRSPFFGPVTITLGSDHFPRFSAFARDLSPVGIGLLHIMPLDRGEVVVHLSAGHESPIAMRTQIIWCEDCGEGWYISGGRFLDLAGSGPGRG